MVRNKYKNYKFKNEGKVRIVGGKMFSDYCYFKADIIYINENFFELFSLLRLTDDMDLIVDTLNDGLRNLCNVFIDKTVRDIEAGKIPRNKFISSSTEAKLGTLSPDEQAELWERETRRSLKYKYKKIYSEYLKENGLFFLETKHSRTGLETLRKALFITPSRIEIDGEKFVEVYTDYMTAYESETGKLHEQAADSINRFFNGAVAITQKELSKYFILENGIVKVNSKSVNTTDYARLGARTLKAIKKDGEKQK